MNFFFAKKKKINNKNQCSDSFFAFLYECQYKIKQTNHNNKVFVFDKKRKRNFTDQTKIGLNISITKSIKTTNYFISFYKKNLKLNREKYMSDFVVDYFRLNEWYIKRNSLISFFSYNSMTIVHKVNRYIFFYLVNIKKRKKKKILEKLLTKSNSFDHIYIHCFQTIVSISL